MKLILVIVFGILTVLFDIAGLLYWPYQHYNLGIEKPDIKPEYVAIVLGLATVTVGLACWYFSADPKRK